MMFQTAVRNPRNETAVVYLHAENVPHGWEVTYEHAWVVLEPLGETRVRAVILTDVGRELPRWSSITSTQLARRNGKLSHGVCCRRVQSGSLTHVSYNVRKPFNRACVLTTPCRFRSTLHVQWQCSNDAQGERRVECAMSGGKYRADVTCQDPMPCPAEPLAGNVACCLPQKGCAPFET